MAMEWKVIALDAETAAESTGNWEPFAVAKDSEGNDVVLCKGLFEREEGKSSTLPENQNWAGNEPDAEDLDLPTEDEIDD